MIGRLIEQADQRARLADVRGIGRVLESLRTNDQALGGTRPDAIAAAYAAIEARLEAARRLRLARDHWQLRVPILAQYGLAMGAPMAILRNLQTALEDIKDLAGSTRAVLASVPRRVERILKLIENVEPPEECQAAHALLVSAAHLARNAAAIRREAVAVRRYRPRPGCVVGGRRSADAERARQDGNPDRCSRPPQLK